MLFYLLVLIPLVESFISSTSSTRRSFSPILHTTTSLNLFVNMFSSKDNTDNQLGPLLEAPSWQQLDTQLRSIETPEERHNFDDCFSIQGSRGPASHKATIRLFDAPDGTNPQVTLYRDTAAWCPYCEKVWLMLEEKRIPYKVEKVPMSCFGDKPASFFNLSPSGGIPVAVIKGRTISESNDIMMALEREFPDHKRMWPSNTDPAYARVTQLLTLERRLFSQWFSWLTSNSDAPRASMHALLSQVDHELSKGNGLFLSSEGKEWEDVTVVDCMFAPFLERMDASLLFYKGISLRSGKYPSIHRWFQTMEARSDTYAGIRSDYYTHVTALPPQIGNTYSTKSGDADAVALCKRAQDEIMGGCWRIGMPASNCLEPLYPTDENIARRDAARRIIANVIPPPTQPIPTTKGGALVSFALRGVGERKGGYRAPLADPKATINERYRDSVDSAFRLIVQNLLIDQVTTPSSIIYPSHPLPNEVKECLVYVRDRVSVPRDMSSHAARIFRSYINCLVNSSE